MSDEENAREASGYTAPEQRSEPVRKPSVPVFVTAAVACARCGTEVNPAYIRRIGGCVLCEGRRNREASDALADAIRQYKAAPPVDGRAETDAIKQLIALGHPNAEGAIRAICHPAPVATKRRS